MRTSMALETHLTIREAANLVNAVFARMKAVVEGIPESANPLDQLDGAADIAVVGERTTLTSSWSVQVYLYDLGEMCGVELVALGQSGWTRAAHGLRRTVSLTRSVQTMNAMVAALRARDPRAQVIG